MGQSPESKYYSDDDSCRPFLQGCAEFGKRIPSPALYCTQARKIGKAGSILFSVRAPVGRINIADQDYVIGRGLAAIEGIEIDHSYLEQYLTFVNPAFRNASQGSTFEAINSSELSLWPIYLPESKPEQTKIAEILSTVDRAIEQAEALIAKQQRLKTGLMQDLLTRGIDEHGNLRSEQTHKFKDSPLGRIPVEWEVVLVGQISKITTGGRDTQNAVEGGEYPFFVRSQTIERINSYSFDGEGVLTAGDGVGVGKVFHYIDGRFDFHQRVYCVHSFDFGVLGFFFYQYFRLNFMARVSQFSAKGSVDSVRMHMISDMQIPMPSLAEQRAFVDFTQKAESELISSQMALHKLRALKAALMQDLLTGRKRVTALLNEKETSA
jgi:type I restriction enzyme S subunit